MSLMSSVKSPEVVEDADEYVQLIPEELIFERNRDASVTVEIRSTFDVTYIIDIQPQDPFLTCSKVGKYKFKVEYSGMRRAPLSNTAQIFMKFSSSLKSFSKTILVKFIDVEEKRDEELPTVECKICLEAYKEDVAQRTPRILKECGHTVCERCAVNLMAQTGNHELRCPFDRRVTSLFGGNVMNLPKNFTVLEMIQEFEHTSDTSPEPTETVIPTEKPSSTGIPCAENPRHDATVFCESCEVNLCDLCFYQVHLSKILSAHKKKPLGEQSILLPKCVQHPENTAEYLCKDHLCEIDNKMMCQTCSQEDHKDHKYGRLLEKLAMNEKRVMEMIRRVTVKEREIQGKLAEKQAILETYSTSSEEFQSKSTQICEYFERKRQEAMEQLRKFVGEKEKSIRIEERNLEKQLTMTVGVKERMEEMVKWKCELHLADDVRKKALVMLKETIPEESNKPLDTLTCWWENGTELYF